MIRTLSGAFRFCRDWIVIYGLVAIIQIAHGRTRTLVLCDIDNTLGTPIDDVDHATADIAPILPLCHAVAGLSRRPGLNVVFLSVRPWRIWFSTRRWIQKHLPGIPGPHIYFVKSPLMKARIAQQLSSKVRIVLIDDMSRGPEGPLFAEAIEFLSANGIPHFGYDQIEAVRQGRLSDPSRAIENLLR